MYNDVTDLGLLLPVVSLGQSQRVIVSCGPPYSSQLIAGERDRLQGRVPVDRAQDSD